MDKETPTRHEVRYHLANFAPEERAPRKTEMPPTDKSVNKKSITKRMPSTDKSANKEWITKVRERVNSARPVDQSSNPCTIFKVPKRMRELDDKAYDPVVASIGPFHHHDPYDESSVMQYHKWRCVRHLLSHHGSQECANKLLDKCLLELNEHNAMVRSCYSEGLPKEMDAQKLALIMLLDGCFIIYLMLKIRVRKESSNEQTTTEKGIEETTEEEEEDTVGNLKDETNEDEGEKRRERTTDGVVVLNIEENEEPPEDPTVAGLFTLDLVVHDLLKLENQIPFFIIQLLFDHLKTSKDGKIDLVDLALLLFKDIHPKESKSFEKKSTNEYHHLLHLFYSSRIPSKKPAESTSAAGCIRRAIECIKSKWKKAEAAPSQGSAQKTLTSAPKWIPSAMELDKAGVKFKRMKLPTDGFLNITFERRKMKITPLLCLLKLCSIYRSGRMEIPPLQIYDYTRPLFRNLIAFEQCYYDTEMYVTIYTLFMDCIIDQAEDVRLLYLEGILEHKLGNDKAMANLFNQLGSEIHFTWKKNYLANQIHEINEFYGFRWHKWLAGLRRDYLGNPWAIISVLAAIFLLLLTFEQSLFSALSYFHHS